MMVVKKTDVNNISGQHEISKNLLEKQNEKFFEVMRLAMVDYILDAEKDKNHVKDNLSYVFSLLQFVSENPGVEDLTPEMEQKILKDQPKWQNYFVEQGNIIKRAIVVFKNYDKQGKLKKLFKNFETEKSNFSDKNFLALSECALEAYEQGVYQDAFSMLSFITTYYPLRYKPYLYLGKVVQELYGLAEASTFYKTTTNLFNEAELFFMAAECEMLGKKADEAKNYLEKALNALNQKTNLSQDDMELKARIEELLNLMDQL